MDRELLKKVRRIHRATRGVYGSPRVHQALRRESISVGRKCVERLMREASLIGRAGRIYRRIPGIERFYERHRNIRLNQPAPTGLNQQWVADLTYIRIGNEWRYLAAVLDAYWRKVIGWSLGGRKTADLTLGALRIAGKGAQARVDLPHGPRRLIRGVSDPERVASMDRPNHCTDNAHMESFFHSLKAEVIPGVSFKREQELRVVLSGYINQFYNQKRLHSGIGYMAPAEYERIVALNEACPLYRGGRSLFFAAPLARHHISRLPSALVRGGSQ